jgi:hypothetical protein
MHRGGIMTAGWFQGRQLPFNDTVSSRCVSIAPHNPTAQPQPASERLSSGKVVDCTDDGMVGVTAIRMGWNTVLGVSSLFAFLHLKQDWGLLFFQEPKQGLGILLPELATHQVTVVAPSHLWSLIEVPAPPAHCVPSVMARQDDR